jgi:hypothetical protein
MAAGMEEVTEQQAGRLLEALQRQTTPPERIDRERLTSWRGPCPSHGDDGQPLVLMRTHSSGRWLLACHGPCAAHDVRVFLGLTEPPWPAGAGGTTRPSMRDRLLNRAQLGELPKPEPLIADTIDQRTVALLAGYWGTGKSFVAQAWAASVATGTPWMGRPVHAGPAFYIAAEGAHGLDPRWTAWEYGWRHTIPAERLTVLPAPVNLLDAAAVDELCGLVAGQALVVVDTLARCMVGGDENSAKDMGMAVDSLYRLREATGDGTVVVVHHTGKDKTTTRGSSALEAGVDTVYMTEGDARLMKMTRTKRKEGPREDTLQLKLSPVLDSAVVASAHGVDMAPSAEQLMSVFMSGFEATGASKAELRAASDMAPATFHRALSALVKGGALVNTGSDQRPFYKAGGQ